VLEDQLDNVPEQRGIFTDHALVRVGRGVVGHVDVQQDQDQVLQTERDPIDVPLTNELCDDAGEHTRDQHTEEHAGDNDA